MPWLKRRGITQGGAFEVSLMLLSFRGSIPQNHIFGRDGGIFTPNLMANFLLVNNP